MSSSTGDKVKFEITIKRTYEVDLADLFCDYGTLDVEEALNIDVDNMRGEPAAFLDDDFEISGRVITD